MGGTVNRTVLRYVAVAGIVLVVGGLFVRQQLADGDTSARLGLLDDRTVALGEPVPDFAIEANDGSVIRLSDFRGKTVVLNFWASWCPPCRAEFPEFQAAHEEREPRGDLVILAVDFLIDDSKAAARAFVEEAGTTFPIAFDLETGDVATRFGVRGLPATFFIDRDGVLRQMNLGPVFGDLLPAGIAAADAGGG